LYCMSGAVELDDERVRRYRDKLDSHRITY